MFESIKSLLPPPIPTHTEKEQKALRRKAASITSSGNILVQFGHFLTKEDIDSLKKKVIHDCR